MYAKLVNGALRRAPNKLAHEGYLVYNPTPDILQAHGYLEVVQTDMPQDAPSGKHYESSYVELDGTITQMWGLTNDTVYETGLTADEALDIITGVTR